MTGKYMIRRLPEHAVRECFKKSRNENLITNFHIEANTFFGINDDLKIRPNAARFAKAQQIKYHPDYRPNVYVVLYSDESGTCCLFMFTLRARPKPFSCSSTPIVNMCRCIGSTIAKPNWETVNKFVLDNFKTIMELSNKQCISIAFQEDPDC